MTPCVLFLLHTESEEPGSLAAFVEQRGALPQYARLYAGDALPDDPRAYDWIVAMGGTMNVYEDERFPFLRAETAFLRTALAARVPVLGVCLGAQLIARACGARVVKSPQPEVGWFPITLTPAAAADPACDGLPPSLIVLQWHEDMAEVPAGAVLLASSPACPVQAFRIGSALALQFHVEMTHELLLKWTEDKPHLRHIADDHARYGADLDRHAAQLYARLWASITPAT